MNLIEALKENLPGLFFVIILGSSMSFKSYKGEGYTRTQLFLKILKDVPLYVLLYVVMEAVIAGAPVLYKYLMG